MSVSMYEKNKYTFLNLSKEEEKKFFNKLNKLKNKNFSQYKKEKDKFILGNLGLVYKIAYQFTSTKLPIEDLIQQGMIGLITAIDYFNIEKDTKFSTYAHYWIWEQINRYRKKNNHIMRRSPVVHSVMFHYSQAQATLRKQLNREPTKQEIAEELNMSLCKLDECLLQSKSTVNLDKPIPNRTKVMYYHDIIPDHKSYIKNATVLTNTQFKYLTRKISRLTENEKLVVGHLFGLIDGRAYIASDIGKMMNLTRERIRQIKNKAFKKLNITTEDYINKWDRNKRT